MSTNHTEELDTGLDQTASYALLILMAIISGAALALVVLPAWLPGLSESLLGPEPKAYWYLSRSSAIVAYILLWAAMALGLSITNKMARIWPGGPMAFDLHQHFSLLSLAFALFHGLILMGDRFIHYNLFEVLVPFASIGYRPLWVGLGQIGLYLMALVGLSFYVRKRIGHRTWRLLHYLSFAAYLLGLMHGLGSGTDSAISWANGLYWASGASLLFLAIYRVLIHRVAKAPERKRAAAG